MSDDAEGFGQGSVNPASAATTGSFLYASFGGIGCDIVSEGASARGDC